MYFVHGWDSETLQYQVSLAVNEPRNKYCTVVEVLFPLLVPLFRVLS